MATILNLTQHSPTPEQVEAGVIDLAPEQKEVLKDLLNFQELPSQQDIEDRAATITSIAMKYGATQVMLGGAPFLMGTLENKLKEAGLIPLYAFSKRVVVEKMQDDGTVVKVSDFKHMGFVEV